MLVKNSDKIYRNHLLAILEPKIPKIVLFISGPPGKRGKRGRRGESGKSLFQLFCVIHVLARFPHLFLLISDYIVLLDVVCMCACVCVCVRCLYLLCYTQNFFFIFLFPSNSRKEKFAKYYSLRFTNPWHPILAYLLCQVKSTLSVYSRGFLSHVQYDSITHLSIYIGGQSMHTLCGNICLGTLGHMSWKADYYFIQLVKFCHAFDSHFKI